MKKNLINSLSNLFPLNFLLKQCELNTFLPFYHGVYKGEEDIMIKHLYPMHSIGSFENDLDQILQIFKPVGLDYLLKSNKGNERTFHLTFDDGLSSCYHLIMPLLKEKNITATFFLNTDFIDNKDLFYRYKVSLIMDKMITDTKSQSLILDKLTISNVRDARKILLGFGYNDIQEIDRVAEVVGLDFNEFLEEKKPYLTSQQIEEMIDYGFTFGGHSCDHPLYKNISEAEQVNQTLESCTIVKEKFNLDYSVFAFPFTDDGVGKEFFEKIEESKQIDLTFGTAGLKKDPFNFNLHRTPMEVGSQSAKRIIKSQYAGYFLKSLVGRNVKKL